MTHQFMDCFGEVERVTNLAQSAGQNGTSGVIGQSNSLDSQNGDENGSSGSSMVGSGGLLGGGDMINSSEGTIKPLTCSKHSEEIIKFYCRSCDIPACTECIRFEHPKGLMHDHELLSDAAPKYYEQLSRLVDDSRVKVAELNQTLKNFEHITQRLQMQYSKAQNEILDTYQFYTNIVEEVKQESLKELQDIYNSRMVTLTLLTAKIEESIRKAQQIDQFMERMRKFSSPAEMLLFKNAIESKLQPILVLSPEINAPQSDLEFVSNYQAIQENVRNTYGYLRSSETTKQPPISRPLVNGVNGINGMNGMNGLHPSHHHQAAPSYQNGFDSLSKGGGSGGAPGGGGRFSTAPTSAQLNGGMTNGQLSNGPLTNGSIMSSVPSPSSLSSLASGANGGGHGNTSGMQTPNIRNNPFDRSSSSLTDSITNFAYEKWSIGGGSDSPDSTSMFTNGSSTLLDQFNALSDPIIDLSTKLMQSTQLTMPIKSQIKRQKMIYHCKFGEFGVMEGQFTEPSGVAVNAQNDIIVADTNNHRIQIFDKEGRFKFQFGECGKRDGQLLYPNRVAVVKTSGDIIVTERSPTHQIQIYNQYGQFVRKFGANILQHPRGVTVDNKGRIIVVECKVMRVIIFDQMGNVIHKFGCSKHLEFPNGVVVNDKQEIFISDNRAHCVKVFSYEGTFLRQIGGEGLTNYPIGVCINEAGEILVADNHNNFNITIFTQDGTLIHALESKVKHAQCFDVALMDDNSVVLASKDYRIYIYRYLQLQSLAQAVAASTLCN